MKKICLGLFIGIAYSVAWGQTFYNNTIPSLPSPHHEIAGRIYSQPFFVFSNSLANPEVANPVNGASSLQNSVLNKNLVPSVNGLMYSEPLSTSLGSSIQGLQFIEPSPLRSQQLLQMSLTRDHVLSVYPTNSTPDHSTACGYYFRSKPFHPTPQLSVCTEHLIQPGLCHCLTCCFSSFLQLLRRRSVVRIHMGRPTFSLSYFSHTNSRK